MLSIVIPTFNEMKHGILQKSIPHLLGIPNVEIICIDHNSTDETVEWLSHYPIKIIQSQANARAKRLNEGIEYAHGDLIFLHHPRSIAETRGIEFLAKNSRNIKYWGAFTHKFDDDHRLLAFTSLWSNKIRGDMRGIYYLDHCLFATKSILQKIGGVPEVDIFEDTLLCEKLQSHSPYKRLPYLSITSAVRFRQNGYFKQALMNQWLKLRYYFAFNHQAMNKQYEQGLNYNSHYQDKD